MNSTPAVDLPPAHTLAWVTVQALRQLGDSGKVEEINETAVELAGLTEQQQEVPHKVGSRTEVEYRLAWARTLCKLLGLATNSERGVWTLTELGRTVDANKVEELKVARRKTLAVERKAKKNAQQQAGAPQYLDDATDDDTPDDEPAWQQELLAILKKMEPAAFERLTKRLLREAGFANVRVVGKTGDGGIDGVGVYRISLVSFPVFFQCKRYAGSVGSAEVRNFRGAMAGRGERGLLITTGTYTASAQAESTRDGAPPIDLIDGDALAELLREHGIGLTSVPRTVYDVTVHPDEFLTM